MLLEYFDVLLRDPIVLAAVTVTVLIMIWVANKLG